MGQSEEKRSTGKRKDEGKKIKRPAAKPEGDDNAGKRKLKFALNTSMASIVSEGSL